MTERENKKFERNLGKAADLRDARLRNAVELRKQAQDDRLKKGRGVTEASSPLSAVQPMAMPGDAVAAAAPVRPQPSVADIPLLFQNIQTHDPNVVLEATRGFLFRKTPPSPRLWRPVLSRSSSASSSTTACQTCSSKPPGR